MGLEQRAQERIAREYSETDQSAVVELLESYTGPEPGRVVWDILELSNGSTEKLLQYLDVARTDYRDILYWAEYYHTDPMLQGRDPKQLADDILAKWGKKE
ncbi:MAG: hypothetical protein ABR611_04230 [Chthoniobacterales bacterium]